VTDADSEDDEGDKEEGAGEDKDVEEEAGEEEEKRMGAVVGSTVCKLTKAGC
jgi:hypothetical protein